MSSADRAVLAGLPATVALRLLADFSASLSGGAREQVTTLAEELGLSRWAAKRCRSRRWWRRLRGVRALTVLGGGDDVVPPLLFDGNSEIRAAAATWAAEHARPNLIERLLDLLEDAEPLPRFTAKNALLRIGRDVAGPLEARLAAARPGTADAGLEVAVGLAERRLLAPALALTSDPSPATRALAATLAGAVGGSAAARTVEGMVDDPEPEVRAAAVASLGKLGHWPAGPGIAEALGDPAWDVRRQAGLALAALGSPGLLLLRRSLSDEDRFARDMARQVLDLPDTARLLEESA